MEYIQVIRQRNFSKLWSAQILSQVAANLLNFALIILVYNLTVGSRFASFAVSLLVLSFAIPSVFAAPMAGMYVDYWDRKWILVAANALRTGLVLLYIPAADDLWQILLLTFVIAIITQFFLPAEAATIPKVVPKKLLLTANSLFVFSMYAAFMVGYSASGPAVEIFGKNGSYFVTAVMFALATLAVLLLPRQRVERPTKKLPNPHLVRQIKENWSILAGHPDRHFSLVQMGILQGIVFILITLAPALSLALLKIPLSQASHILIIPVGIGMVMGILLIGTLTRTASKRRVIEWCMVASGIALIALGLTGQLYRNFHGSPIVPATQIGLIVGSIMLVLGALNSMTSAAAQTLLQETTDDTNRGKVFSSLQMLINLASTLPLFITGLLADLLSVTKVIVAIGGILFVYAVFLLWKGADLENQNGGPKGAPVLPEQPD